MSIKTHLLKKRRQAARIAAFAAIRELPESELRNIAAELGREMNMQSTIVNELRARLDAVHEAQERRRTMTSTGVFISDHAVLRYLERHRGIDMQAVREEIATLAHRSGKLNSGEQYSRNDDAETGLTLGINGISNVVTTVFRDGDRAIIDIPNVKDKA